jgi:RNA polymerase sigma-70 factor (ECF subfamily)
MTEVTEKAPGYSRGVLPTERQSWEEIHMPQSDHTASLLSRAARATESAAHEIDGDYRRRLCALVEREMNARYRRREDPEDVVQSVFRTFFRRASEGEVQFENPDGLWNLLRQIACHKVVNHARFHQAQIRDVSREEPCDQQVLCSPVPAEPAARLLGDALEAVLKGLEPHESEIYRLQLYGLSVGEIVEAVLRGLPAPYPQILQLRLQGNTERQIAEQMQCGREAVRYRLKRLRQRLSFLLQEQSRAQA